jgi:phosphatidylserine/phosphatidylglycerophosphate/cardiolipin synthase-like enzyme
MTDIDTLVTQFFVNDGDVVQAPMDPSSTVDTAISTTTMPETDFGNTAVHLIDGENYFGALRKEIAKLLGGGGLYRFFYTNCWHLGISKSPDMVAIGEGSFTSAWQMDASQQFVLPPFELHDDTVGPFHPMKDDILAMQAAGVDVRILAWADPFLVNFEEAATRADALKQYWAINVHTLRSVSDLRPLIGNDKVVVNTLAHTVGAMHLKMVVCGDSTGFRGYASGMDFVANRNSHPIHASFSEFNDANPAHDYWHDVAIQVEGPAAGGLYDYFQQQWNEEVQRSAKTFKAFGAEIKSHVDDTALVDDREAVPISGKQHTQVLRTLPTMNFSTLATARAPLSCYKRIISGFKQKKISFAPDGIFEFRAAQRKAVGAAQRYIYIEDQAFENLELAGWINARLKAISTLKVILLYMGDPLDGPSPELANLMDGLVAGLDSPADRISFAVAPFTVHSKMTIIDDIWASIGSSNCMRRSFYMDGEVSVSVLDEDVPSFAAKLRKDLWGEHCRVKPGPDCNPLLDLDSALGVWRPSSWGTAPAGFELRTDIVSKRVPFVYSPSPAIDEFPEPRPSETAQERDFRDGDSRLEY